MQSRGQRCSARLGGGSGGGGAGSSGAPVSAAAAAAAGRAAARAAAARRARAAARLAEVEDPPRVLRDKCRRLARAIRNAKHLVVYTGAGISTAADIPDYRGPRGVWTRLRAGQPAPRAHVAGARPTLTHRALAALVARGTLKFVVSQNCDGLHLRAGTPRRALAELHGNMFLELCAACRRVYVRAFDTTERTARHAHGTRRLCHACARELTDSIVHFGERGRAAWPLNWAGALRHAAAADVILCLGSSLKVLRRYRPLWSMERPAAQRPRLYIVNLQWTPKDAVAALKINARCDAVMAAVARRLRLRVPGYSARRDPLLAHATPLAPPERHTTRRAPLPAPPGPPGPPSPRRSDSELSSPSASDSDDERPLTLLARRSPRAPPPPPPPLTAFQVSLASGEAMLLLRPEHAPPAPPAPPAAPDADDKKPLSDLRKFRMWRRSELDVKTEVNGHDAPATNGAAWSNGELAGAGAAGWGGKHEEDKPLVNGALQAAVEAAAEAAGAESECARAARRFIERAVMLCRHQLYPGLHTILAPRAPPAPAPAPAPAAPAPPPACAWCWAVRGSRRCLWYPRWAGARAWRRVGRRRYLCACCGEEDAPSPPAPPAAPDPDLAPDDAPGWFGKGYRKPRRRR
ncbi:unnamed protein product [Plutella xylostella]|uniref:protein acetyllysine N-acetyltransferase n=1 Tax=Plutella xylostella TaxID=51655 RepID=A0A8S4D4I3_PLUXY|nr:NAD-dependent protein deacetylase sirtuin-7 [Plutella xylostella]CAG9092786.1 unnamed protein product [Plutella xylostella]